MPWCLVGSGDCYFGDGPKRRTDRKYTVDYITVHALPPAGEGQFDGKVLLEFCKLVVHDHQRQCHPDTMGLLRK
jgi:hypothetical protein